MVENLVGKLWNSYKRLDMTRKRLFQNGSNWGWNGLKMASELSPSQNQVKTESRLSQLGSTQIDRLESEPSARVWLRLAGVDSGRLGRANDINILEPAKGGSTKLISAGNLENDSDLSRSLPCWFLQSGDVGELDGRSVVCWCQRGRRYLVEWTWWLDKQRWRGRASFASDRA